MIQTKITYLSDLTGIAYETKDAAVVAENQWVMEQLIELNRLMTKRTPTDPFTNVFWYVDIYDYEHIDKSGITPAAQRALHTFYYMCANQFDSILWYLWALSRISSEVHTVDWGEYFYKNSHLELMKDALEKYPRVKAFTVHHAWKVPDGITGMQVVRMLEKLDPTVVNWLPGEAFQPGSGLNMVVSVENSANRIVIHNVEQFLDHVKMSVNNTQKYFTLAPNSDIESHDQKESEKTNEGE